MSFWEKVFDISTINFSDFIGRSLLRITPFRVKKGKIGDLPNFYSFRLASLPSVTPALRAACFGIRPSNILIVLLPGLNVENFTYLLISHSKSTEFLVWIRHCASQNDLPLQLSSRTKERDGKTNEKQNIWTQFATPPSLSSLQTCTKDMHAKMRQIYATIWIWRYINHSKHALKS